MSTQITPALTGKYVVDVSHSQIGFGARHAMVTKVRGTFDDFAGSGFFDAENPANSTLEVTIQATSINTRNADRDAHLRSNDFFAMEEFPVITFKSTAFDKSDASTYKVTGDLTIKGVSNSITVDLEFTGDAVDPWGNQRIGFEDSTSINRKDWGVTWNAALETGGVLVGEKITLEFEVSAIQQKDVA